MYVICLGPYLRMLFHVPFFYFSSSVLGVLPQCDDKRIQVDYSRGVGCGEEAGDVPGSGRSPTTGLWDAARTAAFNAARNAYDGRLE